MKEEYAMAIDFEAMTENDKRKTIKDIFTNPIGVKVFADAVNELPVAERRAVKDQAANIKDGMPLSPQVSDVLWLIVVSAMAILLIGSALVLAFGYFWPPAATDQSVKVGAVVKPELIFALFTSGIGFVTGLFVPSPVSKTKPGQT
jgi:hypothetical protein